MFNVFSLIRKREDMDNKRKTNSYVVYIWEIVMYIFIHGAVNPVN